MEKTTSISPDGRFEVSIDETIDRFDRLYDTVLIERATGRRLFQCQGEQQSEFAADGTLTIRYSGYEPDGLQIDPARGVFRLRRSEVWLPLAAWPFIEAAFGRGWAKAMEYRSEEKQAQIPWVEILLLLGSLAALPILAILPLRMGNARIIFLCVAGAGVLLFGWLSAVGFRAWTHAKKQARALDVARRSVRH